MRYVMTILCSLAFCAAGVSLAITENKDGISSSTGNSIYASTVPDIRTYKMPLDLQLDLGNKYKEKDTVYVPQELVVVGNTESKSITTRHKSKHTLANAVRSRQRLRSPAFEPDTLIKNQVCGDREEYTPDTIGPPKSSIILVVDGKEVYKR